MADFILFNEILEEYENKKEKPISVSKIDEEEEIPSVVNSREKNIIEENPNRCSHENFIEEKGTRICVNCGEELEFNIENDKEWRYYGQTDTKHNSDPNRVHMRKSEDRNIFKDVENLGFSESIIAKANKIYSQVTNGKIFRGNSRRAIVFACVFHAYKIVGRPQSHDRLIKIFNLNRKTGLKGLKHVNLYAPRDSKLRTTYIAPINLVEEIMEQFGATSDQVQEIIDIYNKIKDRSPKLNRSRPQSVASSIVYYWIKIKKKNITLKEFAKKVGLSELTINKIVKEINEITKDDDKEEEN